jgi:hypothetical protein
MADPTGPWAILRVTEKPLKKLRQEWSVLRFGFLKYCLL